MKKNVVYTPRVQVSQYTNMGDQIFLGKIRAIVNAVKARQEEYTDVKTVFDAMSLQFDKFEAALIASADNATPAINVKNYERKLLLPKINEFGAALTAYSKGDPNYITNTTMKLVNVPSGKREPKDMLPPGIKKVSTNGTSGTVKVEMSKLASPAIIVCMEYKTDDMTEWKIGRYFNKVNIKIGDMPSQTSVSFRFFSIDGFGNKSAYSEIFTVSVS